ncbi:unnamed protein product [Ambrosiozyma monospora]|uniref:Unnamed protein product n=1 Tax=Ambrosiozyma monospora TaxID=43982 RepID=A0ACB5SYS2_AMBMO|nr:unnamed protein product [Ambrosiozyma monospora]
MLPDHFTLTNGQNIPSIGLGTWQLDGDKGYNAIKHALQNGYKMLDCAFAYTNQELVGRAIKESGIAREDIFVVDKLANTWHSAAEENLKLTLESLGVEYLDLWLMHWPSPLNHHGNDPKTPKLADGSVDFEKDWDYVKTWKTMVELYRKYPEKLKSIGVANFGVKELEAIIEATGVVPVVNQVELHPSCNQQQLFKFCEDHDIQLVAYSPLGSIGSPLLQNKDLAGIAARNRVTIPQCLISWGVANGWPVIPRSSSFERIDQNLQIVDLSKDDLNEITIIGSQNRQRFVTAPWHSFADI